jgi:DNA polymerase-3 subunit gamma/tau
MDTLYLKYRPQKFEEIMWQDHVKKLFMNAIRSGKIAHSYLFSGPRGTGKTSVARIFAKSLNCENRVDGYEPCNVCESCKEIDAGRSLDVIEMDAASNRGIDEIRAIRDRVVYLPSKSKYKIYIIDEVHMLTREAFNALLKTLEEPPESTIFILATTEIQKVPETVISRCQVLDFRRIPSINIRSKLETVCKNEGINYEIEALDHISSEAAGGMRDALSLLEEIARFSNNYITLSGTLSILGEGSTRMIESYVSSILEGNVDTLSTTIEMIEEEGVDLINFLENVVELASSRINDNGLTKIGKFAIDLIQLLKYEEKQFAFFKVMSIFEALKYKKDSNQFEKIEKVQPVNYEIKTVKSDVERLVDFYSKSGDLAIFSTLMQSDIKDRGDTILVISYVPIHNEILKSKAEQISEEFKSITSREVKFIFASSEIPLDKIEDDVREPIIKILSLFGGKVLPEGGEEVG